MRHPLERLVSAWAFFTQTRTGPGRDLISPATTFPEFVDIIERHVNVHWQPQVEYHTDARGFLPTVTVPLDRIGELWPGIGRHRTSQHGPWRSYYDADLRARALTMYAKDMGLYEGALRYGKSAPPPRMARVG